MATALQHRRRLAKLDTKGLTDRFDASVEFLMGRSQYGVECEFIYPSSTEPCPNCVPNSTGGSAGLYRVGGPMPFERPEACPYCKGRGGFDVANRDTAILIVIFDVQRGIPEWLKPGGTTQMPEGTVMVIGERAKHWDKFIKGVKVVLNTDVYSDGTTYELRNEPWPLGLFNASHKGRSRWFIAYLTRSEGAF